MITRSPVPRMLFVDRPPEQHAFETGFAVIAGKNKKRLRLSNCQPIRSVCTNQPSSHAWSYMTHKFKECTLQTFVRRTSAFAKRSQHCNTLAILPAGDISRGYRQSILLPSFREYNQRELH